MSDLWQDEYDQSAGETTLVSREAVSDMLYRVIRHRVYVEKKITLGQLASESGVPIRMIRAFIENQDHDRRPPPGAYLLSLLAVLGERAVNSAFSLIGYSGAPNNGKPINEIADEVARLIAPWTSKGGAR